MTQKQPILWRVDKWLRESGGREYEMICACLSMACVVAAIVWVVISAAGCSVEVSVDSRYTEPPLGYTIVTDGKQFTFRWPDGITSGIIRNSKAEAIQAAWDWKAYEDEKERKRNIEWKPAP